jgi:hypothetical protein
VNRTIPAVLVLAAALGVAGCESLPSDSVFSPEKSETPAQPVPAALAKAMGRITASSLNIRGGPDASFAKVGALPRGTRVLIEEEQNGWLRVASADPASPVAGWASGKYIERLPDEVARTLIAEVLPEQASCFGPLSEQSKSMAKRFGEGLSASLDRLLESRKGQTANAQPQQVSRNPLKGVEQDLTFVDQSAAMLKLNHLLLNRMALTADSEWPARLVDPEEVRPDYLLALQDGLCQDYAYFRYYGREDTYLSGLSRLQFLRYMKDSLFDRKLTEAMRDVGVRFEHQMRAVDYLPPGCLGPTAQGAEAADARTCQRARRPLQGRCAFFEEPMEDQLYAYMSEGQPEAWVVVPVQEGCLWRPAAAGLPAFTEAFAELLPRHLAAQIDEAERRFSLLADDKARVETQIKEIEVEMQEARERGDQAAAEEAQRHKQVKEAQLDDVEARIGDAERVQERLYHEAIHNPRVPHGDELEPFLAQARNMRAVAEVSRQTLSTAQWGMHAAVAKLVVDARALLKADANAETLIQTMAQEAKLQSPEADDEALLAEMRDRLTRLLRRSATLIPNGVYIQHEVWKQGKLIKPKVDYLDAVIEAGKQRTAERG